MALDEIRVAPGCLACLGKNLGKEQRANMLASTTVPVSHLACMFASTSLALKVQTTFQSQEVLRVIVYSSDLRERPITAATCAPALCRAYVEACS